MSSRFMEKTRLLLLDLLDSSSEDDSDFEFDARLASFTKTRKIWIERHIKLKKDQGEFNIFHDVSDKKFTTYFRIPRATFLEIHDLIKEDIKKKNTKMRECISTEERLAVCLRYLSTGDSFRTIAFSYRIGESTVSNIVTEVCDALWKHLQPLVLKEPTQDEWKRIATEFKELCQFDHCCGSIDGKHVTIKCPPSSGSSFYNYKHNFSIVLLAVADARRRFVMVDIGSKGRFSDGGILSDSEFGVKLKNETLPLPEETPLIPGGINMPFVFVGDEAFPLMKNLMRAYPKSRLTESRRIFNYRLCRARRVVENAFGILATQWRVYKRPMECKVELVDKVVKATCVLHNYFIENSNTYSYIGARDNPTTVPNQTESNQLLPLTPTGYRFTEDNFIIREEFCHYFNTLGSVPWQTNRIRHRLFNRRMVE